MSQPHHAGWAVGRAALRGFRPENPVHEQGELATDALSIPALDRQEMVDQIDAGR